MVTISLAEAKRNLGEWLDRVEGGEEIVITRGGRPVAQLSAAVAGKQPVRSRAAFRARMPALRGDGAALLRAARDEGV